MTDDLQGRLERVPKAELHLHLRGAMPPATLIALTAKYPRLDLTTVARPGLVDAWRGCDNLRPMLDPGPKSPEQIAAMFAFHDFRNFLLTFAMTGFWFRETEDFARLVADVLADLARQNIVYAEITVSVREYLNQGIPLDGLLATLDAAAGSPTRVLWIMDVVRDFGDAAALELVDAVLASGSTAIGGLTIGGSEDRFPPAPFAPAYRRAREAGWRLTAHAGEAAGPASIWSAIRDLGVERIGHGVRAVEDSALVDYLAGRQLPLEVCPTSNLRTGIFADYRAHSVHRLLAAGVPISISTDDPTFFGCTLAGEFAHLREAGLGDPAVGELLRNGYRHAWLGDAAKAAYLEAFNAAWGPVDRPSATR